MESIKDDVLKLHKALRGKIEIVSRISPENIFDEEGLLSMIYTPNVAFVSKEISKNKELSFDYTSKWNNVAIVCDGSRVLGLGNIGPEAALPVMEGKSVLFKILGNVNAFPLCIATQDKEGIINVVKSIEPVFGAVNIEDIESPKVLEIVERLERELSIPVFHDDRHGTAIIALAALRNALKLVKKEIDDIKVVIAGAGSAGYGIFKILKQANCKNIIVTDSHGAIYEGRNDISETNPYKIEIARNTNPEKLKGSLNDTIKGADAFIGVSGKPNILNKEMIRSMNRDPIVFALSNPDPEIDPSDALVSGARIVATGRSDYHNQVNNALVFPSLMRALLDLRIKTLNEKILVKVAYAIADMIDEKHLKENYIVPKVNDVRILPIVNKTLREALEAN